MDTKKSLPRKKNRNLLLADRLTSLRKSRKLSQKYVCKKLGFTVAALSTYENGREPRYEYLNKLAKFYNVTADYLTGNSDSENIFDTEATDRISKLSENEKFTLSLLLHSDIFYALLFYISNYLHFDVMLYDIVENKRNKSINESGASDLDEIVKLADENRIRSKALSDRSTFDAIQNAQLREKYLKTDVINTTEALLGYLNDCSYYLHYCNTSDDKKLSDLQNILSAYENESKSYENTIKDLNSINFKGFSNIKNILKFRGSLLRTLNFENKEREES